MSFPIIRPQDIADILIMTFLLYQLYRWFKNSKALQVLIGLGFLGVLYFVTKNLGLFMTSWILQELGTVFFVLVVVIFQVEIRQALYRFSLLRNLFGRQTVARKLDITGVAGAAFAMAAGRTGALIVLERQEQLDEYLLHGVPLDSLVSSQLLESVFCPASPLHDGALVIRDGRVRIASCHLPLSTTTDLPQNWGTRHRAGIGISERSDAVVIIVSEERGDVSLAVDGTLRKMETPEMLQESLQELIEPPDVARSRIPFKVWLFGNFWPKLCIFLLVVVIWLVVTEKQGGIVTVTAPVRFHNLPEHLALVKSTPDAVDVQLKAIFSLAPSPKQLDLVADLDLSGVQQGTTPITIRPEDFKLPTGMSITSISPSTARVTVERTVRRNLRVLVRTTGTLPKGLHLKGIGVEPRTVAVEGPEQVINRLAGIRTNTVDLTGIQRSTTVEQGLLAPDPPIRLQKDGPVRIRIHISGH